MNCRNLALCMLLLLANYARGEHQKRDLKNAATLLYISYNNNTRPDYFVGADPQKGFDNKGNIITGARRNGCAAEKLLYHPQGNLNDQRGTIAFHARFAPGQQDFLTLRSTRPTGSPMMQLLLTDGYLRPWVYDQSGFAIGWDYDARQIDLRRWHHMAIVWDRDFGSRFFIDGKVVSGDWPNGGWSGVLTPNQIEIHAPEGIDELYVFGRALTAEQIAGLMRGRLPGETSEVPIRTVEVGEHQSSGQAANDQTSIAPTGAIRREGNPGESPRWVQMIKQLRAKRVIPRFSNRWMMPPDISSSFMIDVMGVLHGVSECTDATKWLSSIDGARFIDAFRKDPGSTNKRFVRAAMWAWQTDLPELKARVQRFASHCAASDVAPETRGIQRTAAIVAGRFEPDVSLYRDPVISNYFRRFVQEGSRRDLIAALEQLQDVKNPEALNEALTLVQNGGEFGSDGAGRMLYAAVTWRRPNEVFFIVNRADSLGLHVTAFNTSFRNHRIQMRPWGLAFGDYHLAMGPDADRDDLVDSLELFTLVKNLTRGKSISLDLPPGQSVIELIQSEASPTPLHQMPDMVALPYTHRSEPPNEYVGVSAANLGAGDAKHVTLQLFADGKLLREKSVITLPGATGEVIQEISLRFNNPSALRSEQLSVRVNCRPVEISTENNTMRQAVHLKR